MTGLIVYILSYGFCIIGGKTLHELYIIKGARSFVLVSVFAFITLAVNYTFMNIVKYKILKSNDPKICFKLLNCMVGKTFNKE